ncbi:MAG: hypothetical protein CMQ20_01570 [Gammaproteobacteria bacterium]|jgi:hypothetical protein|nr:hypothetical protein [Gammaproteobacteria bacterium]|tara:strand:+ start:381 stop:899 length:519 start_codon:yes stop_codon:yes gene_type:complete
MLKISLFFWQLCLLQESPDRIPAKPFVLVTILLVYFVIALTTISIGRPALGLTGVIGTVFVGLIFPAMTTWALLAFKQVTDRFAATFSALLGTNSIILLILLPVSLILLNTENESLNLLADSVSWVCLGWWLAIAGYIYHKATNISLIQGSAIAFITELLGVIISVSLFPAS